MKVLVVGSGAREHALVRALDADPEVTAIVAAPGNPGIAETAVCERVDGGITNGRGVVEVARRHDVDLVVIGPEAPLVDGVADDLRSAGLATFGPSARAAQLEGSKAFAKRVMAQAGVPTALAHVCTTIAEVGEALDAFGAPYVVKDDGLAAGKGVLVTSDRDAALAHAHACLSRADGRIVVEEHLEGPEVSLFCLSDGEHVLPLCPAQDFKRVGDGDQGPNTGGMGAYSPLDWAPHGLVDEVVERVARPTIRQMAQLGMPFAGVLYVGLVLTARGPKVIEFNCRFGDPETQVVLARLRTPLAGLLLAAATGRLDQVPDPVWRKESAVAVVLAAPGYPTDPVLGGTIGGLEHAHDGGAYVLHAGTDKAPVGILEAGDNGQSVLRSAGGRVLTVVALGSDLAGARSTAYEAVRHIDLPGGHYRRDIALAAERGEITVPLPP